MSSIVHEAIAVAAHKLVTSLVTADIAILGSNAWDMFIAESSVTFAFATCIRWNLESGPIWVRLDPRLDPDDIYVGTKVELWP